MIVGAGISGIAAAWHLRRRLPHRSLAVLEARDALGGTWDLFRYPGVRSDSDMHTLGYSFHPWLLRGTAAADATADGPAILAYLEETVQRFGLAPLLRLGHRVVRAAWSSAASRWVLEVETRDEGARRISCSFLYLCTGYYAYEAGHTPELPGIEGYAGRVVHPQQWPADLDWSARRVLVIGSGATAVTLVPALAARAAHVVMLQRSPTYVVPIPRRDRVAAALRRLLPARAAARLVRWRSIVAGHLVYRLARGAPDLFRRLVARRARHAVGPGFDLATHFTPRYAPWDQRLCVAPDGDLFAALRAGRASVVTDTIERFTARGVRLASGGEIDADLVVTATGLELRLLGGMELVVDGARVEPARTLTYRGMMLSDVPNLALAVGYTNASWTLKCELTARYVCRLLAYMERHRIAQCTPRRRGPVRESPAIDLTSGYVRRALDRLPRQGPRPPWRLHQSYFRDALHLRACRIDDGVLELRRAGAEAPRVA